jgi:hypothetical protein
MKKGISEVVSFVLIITIMITATMAAYLWANATIPTLNEPGRIKSLVNQMISLDGIIKSTAHGDINFTTTYQLYYPDSYFELRNTTRSLNSSLMPAIILRQKLAVLGYSNASTATTCTENYTYDSSTFLHLYRYNTVNNVYTGAAGSGPGQAEIAICYTNINVTYSGRCVKGKTGPVVNLKIKKEGVSGTMPVVSIEVC